MTPQDAKATASTLPDKDGHNIFERSGRELILYRLRCTQTANGLSHYYMYGDLPPDETLL